MSNDVFDFHLLARVSAAGGENRFSPASACVRCFRCFLTFLASAGPGQGYRPRIVGMLSFFFGGGRVAVVSGEFHSVSPFRSIISHFSRFSAGSCDGGAWSQFKK